MGILTGYDQGYRLTGPVTNLALAAVANAVAIFQVSNSPLLVGTKSVRIKRLKIWNNAAGNTTVLIGTGAGAGFAILIPSLFTVNGMTDDYPEGDLPGVESFADITAYPLALAAGGSIDIQIEVEEIG